MAEMSVADALKLAIQEEMRRDETVFCLGEDVDIKGGMGGAFTVTKGLLDEFGPERVINTPIAEILIAGVCVGAGMTGMRPVADLQYGDFLLYVRRKSTYSHGHARTLRGDQPGSAARPES